MTIPLRLRPYLPADRPTCIALFESNVPEYFGAHEQADFLECIDEDIGPYFVLEDAEGQALGCGGYAAHPDWPATAALTWGMIRRDLHGRSLGTHLLAGRLDRIRMDGRFDKVRIETTPMSRGFFERFGFAALRTEPDGFGQGYDLVEMLLAF
jgi:N-acetylglutamate synthase-like GNAT family acetyltransferase